MSLIGLLVAVIVLGLVFYLAWLLINMLPLPQPFKTVALVILILIAIIVLLDYSGLLAGGIGLRSGRL